jgi:predicted DNA-binding transcriptional regulator AlpA
MSETRQGGQLDRLITEKVTAEILGVSPDTLRRLGQRGEGPLRRKISPRRVGYKVSEVEAYRDGKTLDVSEHQPGERGRRPRRARK